MSICEAMLREMAEEGHAARRLFEREPEDKLSWKPHPTSCSPGRLALHIAQIPGNVTAMAAQDVVGAPSFADELEAKSRQELRQTPDQGLATAREILSTMDDKRALDTWSMRQDGRVLTTVPRVELLRSILLNHHYHHRGQPLYICGCWPWRFGPSTGPTRMRTHLPRRVFHSAPDVGNVTVLMASGFAGSMTGAVADMTCGQIVD